MFQPNPKPLIPLIIKARVPGWLLVAAIVAQYAITAAKRPEEPSCLLNLERVHHSTSVNERVGKDAVKLNITSECTQEQIQTQLSTKIFSLRNGKEVTIYHSDPTVQFADKRDGRKAYFLDFWVECKRGSVEMYRGSAEGIALLKNNWQLQVSGNTGNYLAVKCESKAK